MSIHTIFKTDKVAEVEGITLNYDDKVKVRIARAGGSNTRYLKVLERKSKPYRRAIQQETLDPEVAQQILREAYAEGVVLGWEGITDEATGKEIPFSPAAAAKLFKELPDFFADIQEQAQKAALFRAEVREAEGKN